VRYAAFGEGGYAQTETAIRALLAEAGARVGNMSHPTGAIVPSEQATPETYLGTARAQGWINGPLPGLHDYGPPPSGGLALNDFAYSGTWRIGEQPATAVSDAGVDVEFQAKDVYLVLSSAGERPRRVQVWLDGRPISSSQAGSDVRSGLLTVRRQRLYALVSLSGDERHHLRLRLDPGVAGYAFTFG
jgi:Thioredoxin like C-terminal domain